MRQQENSRFIYITTLARKKRKQDGADKISLQIWKTGYLSIIITSNQNKSKTIAPYITHLKCSLVLLLTVSLQLQPSIFACLNFIIMNNICSLIETMWWKFWEISRIRPEVWQFLKIQNGSINLLGIASKES